MDADGAEVDELRRKEFFLEGDCLPEHTYLEIELWHGGTVWVEIHGEIDDWDVLDNGCLHVYSVDKMWSPSGWRSVTKRWFPPEKEPDV